MYANFFPIHFITLKNVWKIFIHLGGVGTPPDFGKSSRKYCFPEICPNLFIYFDLFLIFFFIHSLVFLRLIKCMEKKIKKKYNSKTNTYILMLYKDDACNNVFLLLFFLNFFSYTFY
jgi:hypothetical protein